MPENFIAPLEIQPGETPSRYTRTSFRDAGIDNYSVPPAQDPDSFMQLLNILPATSTGVLNRRWGYRAFNPKIDAAANTDDDEFLPASTNPTIKAQHLYEYESIQLGERTVIATAADGTGSGSTTNTVGYWDGSGTFQSIFTPSSGAMRPYGVDSRDVFYFQDGVSTDLKKWTLNGGSQTSKWGITAPATRVNFALSTTANGSWNALTVMSTFGITVDSNSNIQYLVSINANGTNGGTNATIGLSGKGAPAWSQTPGATTSDGTITWTNKGPIGLWQANHAFSNGHLNYGTTTNPAFIYDPSSNCLFLCNSGSPTATSGFVYPTFSSIAYIGGHLTDYQISWEFFGSCDPTNVNYVGQWAASTYTAQWGSSNDFHNKAVLEQTTVALAYNTLTASFNQTIYVQAATSQGTSLASYSHPSWCTTTGGYTDDNQLRWLNLGPAAWAGTTSYTAWSVGSTSFGVVQDSHNNIEVCITGGTSGGGTPSWPASYVAATYGTETNDGATVVWAAVGPAVAWAASTDWFLPLNGFVPPASTSAYGGASIVDSNNCLESIVISGKTGSSAPAWNTVGNTTTDSGATWFNVESLAGISTGGNITLLKGRYYFAVFLNNVTGALSDLNPVSALTGPVSNGAIYLYNIPTSSDPQVSNVVLLATLDGGNQEFLYYLTTITNGTTTYVDSIPDSTLSAQNTYLSIDSSGVEHGVADNDPPVNGLYVIKHRGRLYQIYQNVLFYSKSTADLTTSTGFIAGKYEEAWPASYQMDVSEGAEKVNGLFSDGQILYIGTSRRIRRLRGDSPSNFISPETVHDEVGLNNQETWKVIYSKGLPAGSVWLTPDFRVIRSDFNVYDNIGEKVQTTLNTINPAASQNCWATFVGIGPYTFYVLAIPTGSNTNCDTLLIYSIDTGRWLTWKLADICSAGLYYISLAGIPRWMFTTSTGTVDVFDTTKVLDQVNVPGGNVGITSTIQTAWLPLGDPTLHKLINEIEVISTITGMQITVEGASTAAQFQTPNTVVSNTGLIFNFMGNLKAMLAAYSSRDRFYRFTFTMTSTGQSVTTDSLMDYFSIEAIPFNRI